MKLKIATWNINSVRLRVEQLAKFSNRYKPDIICLQEIKCQEDQFPIDDVKAMGYEHICINGQKAYHGVATLSRIPIHQHEMRDLNKSGDARHLSVKIELEGDQNHPPLICHNFYIPAGGDIPDPDENLKFKQKLTYLRSLARWFKNGGGEHSERMLLVGDLNIAPLEQDVWSHKQMLKIVSHTPVEVSHLSKVQKSLNWHDVMREFVPEDEPLFTWWSYRAKDWRASNRGRRLDHIWVTPDLSQTCRKMTVLDQVRDWPQPSDHAPVVAEFDFSKGE